MRRLLRILLNAATVLSVLLCVATVVLWGRSYQWCDDVQINRNTPTAAISAAVSAPRGCIQISYRRVPFAPGTSVKSINLGWRGEWRSWPVPRRWDSGFSRKAVRWEFARFAYAAPPASPAIDQWLLTFPLWFPTLGFAIAPATWTWWRGCRRRVARSGVCLTCGYDLRATPDRCPECGTTSIPFDRG
jgi:hypothetical protein